MRPVGRRVVKVAVASIAATVTCMVVVALVLGALAHDLSTGLSFPSDRPKPIPVAARACPYLHAVSTTSDAAGSTMFALVAVGEPGPSTTAVATATAFREIPDQLAALDLSLRVAATQVPPRLRRKLDEVARDVEAGRVALARSTDAEQFSQQVFPKSLSDGVSALSYASDLVGDQCHFPLTTYAF